MINDLAGLGCRANEEYVQGPGLPRIGDPSESWGSPSCVRSRDPACAGAVAVGLGLGLRRNGKPGRWLWRRDFCESPALCNKLVKGGWGW